MEHIHPEAESIAVYPLTQIVHYECRSCLSDVYGSQTSEPFLSRGVPDLQHHLRCLRIEKVLTLGYWFLPLEGRVIVVGMGFLRGDLLRESCIGSEFVGGVVGLEENLSTVVGKWDFLCILGCTYSRYWHFVWGFWFWFYTSIQSFTCNCLPYDRCFSDSCIPQHYDFMNFGFWLLCVSFHD